MTFCGSNCITILLCLTIFLVVCQILTVTALIILYNIYSDLKKRTAECQKNLIATQILETQERAGTSCSSVALKSEINKRWEKDSEESPTRVPTPPSDRRSGYKQETPELYRTQSRISQEMLGFPRDTSFTSAKSRDSGTGSISTRTPQTSFSCGSKLLWQDPLSEKDFKVVREKPVSRDSQISQSPFNVSRENQNELQGIRSSRLETMAIGMIGREEDERWQEDGVSRWGDQDELKNSHSSRLQTMVIGMIREDEKGVVANKGYDEGSSTRPAKTRLVGEDLVRELNSESQNTDENNETNEKDEIKKKWHKEGEETPTLVPSPPSDRRRSNRNEAQDSSSSRGLETMAIGMIGLEGSGSARERKDERLSGEFHYGKEEASLSDDESMIDTRL